MPSRAPSGLVVRFESSLVPTPSVEKIELVAKRRLYMVLSRPVKWIHRPTAITVWGAMRFAYGRDAWRIAYCRSLCRLPANTIPDMAGNYGVAGRHKLRNEFKSTRRLSFRRSITILLVRAGGDASGTNHQRGSGTSRTR